MNEQGLLEYSQGVIDLPEVVYMNGSLVPYNQALVSVEDRGFTFADGVYEVIRCYGGSPFRMTEHLERLQKSAKAIRLDLPFPFETISSAVQETLAANSLEKADAAVYIQVTRGPAPRAHALPVDPRPTLYIITRPEKGPRPELRKTGVKAITTEDLRWHMCHIKSTGLLLNSLAKQKALESGCYEAIFVREGIVTEGTSSNLFVVKDRTLWTHPEGNHILSGVTRSAVLEIAAEKGIPVKAEKFTLADLHQAEEVFITGTITEVMPVVEIDGRLIGTGKPGEVTQIMGRSFARLYTT